MYPIASDRMPGGCTLIPPFRWFFLKMAHLNVSRQSSIVAPIIGICKGTFRYILSEAKSICLIFQSLCRKNDIPEILSIGKLTEHQDSKLIIASELLHVFVTFVFPRQVPGDNHLAFEVILGNL